MLRKVMFLLLCFSTVLFSNEKEILSYQDLGFSISKPDGWEVTRRENVIRINYIGTDSVKTLGYIKVIVSPIKTGTQLEDLFEVQNRITKMVSQEFKINKKSQTEIDDHTGLFYDVTFKGRLKDSKTIRMLSFTFIQKKRAYMVTCSANIELFEEIEDIMVKTCKSFKFLD